MEIRLRRLMRTVVVIMCGALVASDFAGCSFFDKKVDVLYIGDSIMLQSTPFAEAALVAQPGVESVKAAVEAENGTGLLTPTLRDWVAEAPGLADKYQPKAVVILFIGNYTDGKTSPFWTGTDGQPIVDYDDRFFEEWGKQAEKITNIFASRGSQVDWVLPPPLASDEGARREARLRQTYLDLAKRIPSVSPIDGRGALGGSSGEWVWRRPGIDGGEVTVRAADSVHLTEDGGRLMAREIAKVVSPQLVQIRARQQA